MDDRPVKAIAEIRVPATVAPFMERHGKRALQTITDYCASCRTIDEKLGALGVLAQILLAYGDSLQAIELQKTPEGRRN